MNRMMSPRWVISFITFFRRSSNSPRYFDPGDEGREVQRVDLLALQQLGNVGVRDPLGQALDHGRLADAGLADEHGVVLRAPREDLHDPLDLGFAPDDGVELALGGELGQVAPETGPGAWRTSCPRPARRVRPRRPSRSPGRFPSGDRPDRTASG